MARISRRTVSMTATRESMSARLRTHLRSSIVGYIALFVAMSGAAYAATAPRNSVVSRSIRDGEVKSRDVGTNQIRSADVRNDDLAGGGLLGKDIADGSLTGGDIVDGSVAGADVADGNLTGVDILTDGILGSDINEDTLDKVPAARSADNGGTGHYANGSCDPESTTYVDCAVLYPLTLSSEGRVLFIATVAAETETTSDHMEGACVLNVNGVLISSIIFNADDDESEDRGVLENGTMVAAPPYVLYGNQSAVVQCNQWSAGAIQYPRVRIVAVTLSAN